jgi:hypothetical protein
VANIVDSAAAVVPCIDPDSFYWAIILGTFIGHPNTAFPTPKATCMSHALNGLLFAWKKNLDYAQKLVADLTEEQMVAQPVPGPQSGAASNAPCNHPAWVFSHLNVYLPIIQSIIKGKTFDDPKEHPFGMLSKPESDRSIYEPKQELVDAFVIGHVIVIELLEKSDESVLGNPVRLPRWQPVMPFAGMALNYLMLNHENGHLGQVSAWRRILGMPSV